MSYVDAFTVLATTFGLEDVKKGFAGPLSAQTYTVGAGLDGDKVLLDANPAQCVSINTSATASAWNVTDPIRVIGERLDGGTTEVTVKLTTTNGGETVETTAAFRRVTSVYVPAQLLGTGTMKIGLGTVEFDRDTAAVEVGASGAIKVVTARGFSRDLTLPANTLRDVSIRRVRRDTATFPVTVYLAS